MSLTEEGSRGDAAEVSAGSPLVLGFPKSQLLAVLGPECCSRKRRGMETRMTSSET